MVYVKCSIYKIHFVLRKLCDSLLLIHFLASAELILGQVQILWMQDLPIPFPFRERFAHCKAKGRRQLSSESFNNGKLLSFTVYGRPME